MPLNLSVFNRFKNRFKPSVSPLPPFMRVESSLQTAQATDLPPGQPEDRSDTQCYDHTTTLEVCSTVVVSSQAGQSAVKSDEGSARHSPSSERLDSPAQLAEHNTQDFEPSLISGALVSPIDLPSLWKDALDEYAKRTGMDLTTDPLTIRLKECDSLERIMAILDEHTQAFREFRNGDAKVQLLRTLNPIVTAVLALGPGETLGEGVGVIFQPAQAIVGAIIVLLKATREVSASYDSLVDLLNCVSKFLERLRIYTRMSLTTLTKETLVKTLASMVSILALATEEVEQGCLKKYVRTLLGNTDVRDALEQLTRLSSTEAQMVGVESLRIIYSLALGLNELMKSGKQSTVEIKHAFENLRSSMTTTGQIIRDLKYDSDVQKHHRWLSPPDPSVNHNLALKSYSDGTCAWFIDGEVMGAWKTTSSLLWIHGIPGSGKTTLCTAIIEDISRLCLIQQKTILAYFYCDFQDTAKQTARGLLSHLLVRFSVVSSACRQLLAGLWTSHRDGLQQPNERDLRQCLKRMLGLLEDHCSYIVIDALDECPDDSLEEHSKRRGVLKLICEITEWCSPNVHVCVSSRPEKDIREALGALSPRTVSLHAEDGQADEITDYVRSVIESGTAFQRWKAQDRALAIQRLSEKANGMFRWAFCQLEMLRGCLPATIRKALDDLPKTLDETYRRVLQSLDTPSWRYTHHLFQCLVVCARPLRVDELAEVLAIDFDSEPIPEFCADWRPLDPKGDILSMCSSMIVIDAETETVQFAHFSVQEYLISARLASDVEGTIHRFHILEEQAHATLAKVCLGILLQFDNSNTSSMSPLSAYAAQYWIDHAKTESTQTDLQEALEYVFDPRKTLFRAWCRLRNTIAESDRRVSAIPAENPLYCTSLNSLYRTTQFLLTTGAVDVNARCRYPVIHGSALQAACVGGQAEVARLLIEHGADVKMEGGYYGTALQAASARGHVDIAHLLIEHGADVNTESGHYGTVLQAASARGHVEVARLLIEHGAAVNVESRHYGTALHAASFCGHLEVARLLIDRGADVKEQGGRYGTALQAACAGGHLEVARLLIDSGADIKTEGGYYGIALQAACASGHVEAARLLIGHGADVGRQCGYYGTVLQAACAGGHLQATRLVIEAGADVKEQGGLYGNALQATCAGGHVEVALLLIEHGVNVKEQGGPYGTALQAACAGGHVEVAHLLLEHGADVKTEGGYYGTALQAACARGHAEAARLLIEHGADIKEQSGLCGTALQATCASGHLDVARLLIAHGADVKEQGEFYGTALQAACAGGHFEVARLLIEHGADVKAGGGHYGTALQAACAGGHLGVARLLIENSADVKAEGGRYGMALQAACAEGHFEVVRLLIEHGAQINMQSDECLYGTALQAASLGSHLEIRRLLVEHGADGMTAYSIGRRASQMVISEEYTPFDLDTNERRHLVKRRHSL